jgi:Cu(I)/Ag(I) efflux system membrane fusion protein
VITIYSPTNGIVQGTESMTTAAGSMQNSSTTTSSLTLKEGDYIKKDGCFKLVNTDKVWGVLM